VSSDGSTRTFYSTVEEAEGLSRIA